MVPYYKDKYPGIEQWTGTGMNATVLLDQPGNVSFTNLDEISGRVVVRCGKAADVNSIVVKLEGESRTRLLSPGGGPNNEKPRPYLEYHKILYKVRMVFPPADVLEGRSHMSGKPTYTLPQGQHEYPFSFKIPFNNTCHSDKSQMPAIAMSGTGLEIAKPATRHVKKTLPPTLSGFPGEAEIRYFVKATVARHSIFKENPRAYTPFNFFPIEPPRPPSSGSEVYARQKHSFTAFPEGEPVKSKMKGIFGLKSSAPNSPQSSDAPAVSVDVRLPEPAILTCNTDVPLRIIVKKLNSYSDPIYLQSLQISLIGLTKIRAHEVFRTESNSWVLMSRSNMGIAIGKPADVVDTETVLDEHLWRGQTLPNTVAPSFQTCNISREYQLDIRVGLSYSGNVQNAAKPQSIVLPLRLDTFVYSGIAPPRQLLEAMADAQASIGRKMTGPVSDKLRNEGRKLSQPPVRINSEEPTSAIPPTPIDPSMHDGFPAQAGNGPTAQPPQYNEAPPSYEDAIASNLPPVDSARPEYAPPPAHEDDVLRRDEKKGWVD